MDLVEAFMSLFEGSNEAYGTYEINSKRSEDNKLTGKATTIRKPVTRQLWEDHLSGKKGIGIIPIRNDNTVRFGAIDVDQYPLDVSALAARLSEQGLPLVPCLSKSGGAHLYLFTTEPVDAGLMQLKLRELAAHLGYGGSEIFPKQAQILADRGDLGQWINMPYFNHKDTTRYALAPNGTKLDTEDFVKLAQARSLTRHELLNWRLEMDDALADGPPCLQHLAKLGFPPGTRNDGLFNLGVYLRKAFPDTWETELEHYNQTYLKPPLSSEEVQGVKKSLKKKSYAYTCDKFPIRPHCNIQLCRTRDHGIGKALGMPNLSSLTKLNTMPPVWFVDVEGGGRMSMSTEDLQNQTRFQKRCMDALNTMPPLMPRSAWQSMIQKMLDNVQIIDMPEDASERGQFFGYLERFLTGRVQAANKEEMLLGKPWFDDESRRYHFRMVDLMAFLDRHKFTAYKQHQISALLKEFDATHHFYLLKGKGTNCWSLDEQLFTKQVEGHEAPKSAGTRPY